jgi:hypothetical protein
MYRNPAIKEAIGCMFFLHALFWFFLGVVIGAILW